MDGAAGSSTPERTRRRGRAPVARSSVCRRAGQLLASGRCRTQLLPLHRTNPRAQAQTRPLPSHRCLPGPSRTPRPPHLHLLPHPRLAADRTASVARTGGLGHGSHGPQHTRHRPNSLPATPARRAARRPPRRRQHRAQDRSLPKAFENEKLDPALCQRRINRHHARPQTLHGQEVGLARQLAADADTAPNAAQLAGLAGQLDQLIAATPTSQRTPAAARQRHPRAHRRKIIPIYRIPPAVRATPRKVELAGRLSKHSR
jgi:hypothetical protein